MITIYVFLVISCDVFTIVVLLFRTECRPKYPHGGLAIHEALQQRHGDLRGSVLCHLVAVATWSDLSGLQSKPRDSLK